MPYLKMAPITSNENCAPTCLQLLGLCSPVAAVCSSISPAGLANKFLLSPSTLHCDAVTDF